MNIPSPFFLHDSTEVQTMGAVVKIKSKKSIWMYAMTKERSNALYFRL